MVAAIVTSALALAAGGDASVSPAFWPVIGASRSATAVALAAWAAAAGGGVAIEYASPTLPLRAARDFPPVRCVCVRENFCPEYTGAPR